MQQEIGFTLAIQKCPRCHHGYNDAQKGVTTQVWLTCHTCGHVLAVDLVTDELAKAAIREFMIDRDSYFKR